MIRIQLALLAVMAISIVGCDPGPEEPKHPLLVIGVDGLEWDVLRPLLLQEKLPNLSRLIEGGVCGELQTYKRDDYRTISPVIWTTVATGKNPARHKIRDFFYDKRQVPYWSRSRQGKAIWNITSDHDFRTHVCGWWLTWPAEEICGYMVSSTSATAQYGVNWKGSFLEGVENQTHPPSLEGELRPIIDATLGDSELAKELVFEKLLPDVRDPKGQWSQIRGYVEQTAMSLVADEFYVRAMVDLAKRETPSLGMVYIGGTDVVSHRFWGFRESELYAYPLPGGEIEGIEQAVDNYYQLADEWIGRLLAAYPPHTQVFVVSDHGFTALPSAFERPTPSGVTGGHPNGPDGLIIASGPLVSPPNRDHDIRQQESLPIIGHIEDLVPTWLNLMGLPLAEDLDGRPLAWAKTLVEESPGAIRTHDEGFRLPTKPPTDTREKDTAYLELLKALGYLDNVKEGRTGEEENETSSDEGNR